MTAKEKTGFDRWEPKSVKGRAAKSCARAGWFCSRSALYGATMTMRTWPARIGTGLVAVPVLAGADGLAWPALVGLVGAGSVGWHKRSGYEDRIRRAVYRIVEGHRVSDPPKVHFGLSRWVDGPDFAFEIPPEVRQADQEETEAHLRERLPAQTDSSWSFDWNWRTGRCEVALVPDMPAAITRAEFREVLAGHPQAHLVGRDAFPVGLSVEGIEVWDVEAAPHVLATGETGKGKSVAQLGILCHALEYPADWRIVACDPKRVELGYLDGYENVECVAKDLEDISEAIKGTESEMDRRFRLMEAGGANHIRNLDPRAKRLLVVVDELQQVTMPSGAKDPESKQTDELKLLTRAALERIAALGRAAGVHLYLSTQRPDVALGILTGPLKHNLTGRLACGPMDNTASMMALDTDAATTLPKKPKGRAIWRGIEGEKRVQVIFTRETDLPPKGSGKAT